MSSRCLLLIIPLSFECLEECFGVVFFFFSVYFLFPLSNCSVLSHYRICLKLDFFFNKPVFFPLLMFEAILAMLYDFSEIIFEGLVFSVCTQG